ncbi:MAG TPA: DUF1223 domain-containing protein [Candidatus Limnocylindria bacterium]|nr:DUF1223 domain-containing protein [Candidatus Limnocylindria bacterium]
MKGLSIALTVFAVLRAVSGTTAEGFSISSGPRQVALVELFSSEGCSSCPPADRWLGSLEQASGLWADFVPVAFQVDYWDTLGWKDRFGSKANTQRQIAYAETGKSSGVYTPELMLNGQEWRGWGRVSEITKSLKPDAGVLTLKVARTNQLEATYRPPTESSGQWDLTIAWVGSNVVTDVARGENSGRKLPHHFVALKRLVVPLVTSELGSRATLACEPPTGIDGVRLALISWVSQRDSQTPFQAAGGWWLK